MVNGEAKNTLLSKKMAWGLGKLTSNKRQIN